MIHELICLVCDGVNGFLVLLTGLVSVLTHCKSQGKHPSTISHTGGLWNMNNKHKYPDSSHCDYSPLIGQDGPSTRLSLVQRSPLSCRFHPSSTVWSLEAQKYLPYRIYQNTSRTDTGILRQSVSPSECERRVTTWNTISFLQYFLDYRCQVPIRLISCPSLSRYEKKCGMWNFWWQNISNCLRLLTMVFRTN